MTEEHKYTIVTNRGEVNLKTPNHHSKYATLEHFVKDHQAVISDALQATGIAVSVVSIYLGHGRGGSRLK